LPHEPAEPGVKYRAALEALAYLIVLGVQAHENAGQNITRITVSGGIARSALMCEILASVINRRLERLQSDEGSALGAAVTALAALENFRRKQRGEETSFSVGDAVAAMVKFHQPATPQSGWHEFYHEGLQEFERRVKS
jgi:sugar (pentulose or hexulose) kinase